MLQGQCLGAPLQGECLQGDSLSAEHCCDGNSGGGGGGGGTPMRVASGSFADRDTVFTDPNAGDMYVSFDAGPMIQQVYTGAAWIALHADTVVTPPVTDTWLSQGVGSTVDETGGIGVLLMPEAGGDQFSLRTTAWAGKGGVDDRQVTLGYHSFVGGQNFAFAGLVLEDSVAGRYLWFAGLYNGANDLVDLMRFTSPTTFSASPFSVSASTVLASVQGGTYWLRVIDDGTNIEIYLSGDRASFPERPLFTEARASWLTNGPDRVGYGIRTGYAGGSAARTHMYMFALDLTIETL